VIAKNSVAARTIAESGLRQGIGRYRERLLLIPYPRESIAAANSRDLDNESSRSGRAMERQDGFSSPRNNLARRMREILCTKLGSAEVAITVATPNS
jgi:hypothetical protein